MEKIEIVNGDKSDVYISLIPQIHALINGEEDLYANLANVTAALKEAFGFFWVGFYLAKKDSNGVASLVLGPFQGPVACTRIPFGKGVCGASWKEKRTLIVPDVDKFPGHIACSSLSRSEIVVPFFKAGEVVAVLDVDSDTLDSFDEVDASFLSEIFPEDFWDN